MKFLRNRRKAIQNLVHVGTALLLPGSACKAADGALASAVVQSYSDVVRTNVPTHFIGFNMNVLLFGQSYWSSADNQPVPGLLEAMSVFRGAYLRYPGGLIANNFCSDWAIGPQYLRRRQKLVEFADAAPVAFGPEEYFRFAASIGAKTIYTLNLVGWDEERFGVELSSEEVAAANGRLAALRVKLDPGDDQGRLYHLGNELDRSRYEWPLEKYVQRCKDTMAAVRAVDGRARFVAFLRDFDYAFQTRSGVSKGSEFSAAVLAAIPELTDGSLQIYYDRPANEGNRFDLTWRWKLIDGLFASLSAAGRGYAKFWVTEHAQYLDMRAQSLPIRNRLATTSGISGAIASADFVMNALQRPRIQAAMWHALGGVVWWDLFEFYNGTLRPTPAYWVLKLMRENLTGDVMRCGVSSSNVDAYSGGYDVNVIVLRQADRLTHLVHVANRSTSAADVTVVIPSLVGRVLDMTCRSIVAARPPGEWVDELDCMTVDKPRSQRQTDTYGRLTVRLQGRSFSVIRLAPC